MAKKVIVLDENGKQFELTPTRILERDSFGSIYRFVKKTSIRKALKAFAADSQTLSNEVVLQHPSTVCSDYEVNVSRLTYGTPDVPPVHIGCITFLDKNATKIANWASKVVSRKTGKKTVLKARGAAAGRAKRA